MTPAASKATQVTAPSFPFPLSEAVQELTGHDVTAIEAFFKTDFTKLSGMKMTVAVVWAQAQRFPAEQRLSWNQVNSLTMRQLNAAFEPEPDDVDESEPDSEAGKDE